MSSATARLLDNRFDELNDIIYNILTTRFRCGDLTIISVEFSNLFDVSTLVNIINSDPRISSWFTLSDYKDCSRNLKDLIIAKELDRLRLKSCDRLILSKQEDILQHLRDKEESQRLSLIEKAKNNVQKEESRKTEAYVAAQAAKKKGTLALATHQIKKGAAALGDRFAGLAASSPSSSSSEGESIYDVSIKQCNKEIEQFQAVKHHMDDTYFQTELLSKNNKLKRIERFFRSQAIDAQSAQSAVIYCGNITCQRSLGGQSLSVVVNYKLNISSEVKVTIDPATQLEIFDSVQTSTISPSMLDIVNTRENKIERCKTCVIDVLEKESLQTAPPAPPSALSSMTPNGTHGNGMYSFDLDGISTITVMNPELPVVVSQQGCLGRCCSNDFIGGTKKTKKKSRHSKRKSKNMRRKNKSRRKKTY